jgi:hypothetical protein
MIDIDPVTLYFDTWYATSAVQALFWAVMLVKVYCGTSFLYVKMIAWLLLISSVSAGLSVYAYDQVTKTLRTDPEACLKWAAAQATGIFLKDAGSCLSHWIFCFKYFKIGTVHKYFMAEE